MNDKIKSLEPELLTPEESKEHAEQERIEIEMQRCCENCESFEESSMQLCDRGHCAKNDCKVWTFNYCEKHHYNWLFLTRLDDFAKDFDEMNEINKTIVKKIFGIEKQKLTYTTKAFQPPAKG